MSKKQETDKSRRFMVKHFISYIKPFRKGIIVAWALLLVNILMRLPMPLLTMYLIDTVVASQNTKLLNILCFALFFFLIVQTSSSFLQRKIIIKIQNRIITNIRLDLYQKLIRTNLKYFDKVKAGDLITRITSDVGKLQGLLADTIISLLTDCLSLIVGVVVLLFLHWKLALISMAVIPLYLFSIKFFSIRVRQANSSLQNEFSGLASNLFESFLGIYFVKAFSTEDLEIKRTSTSFKRLLKVKNKSDLLTDFAGIIASYISAIGRFILIWYGLTEIINGSLTIGGFLAFNSFLRYIYDPSKNLMNLNTAMQKSIASLERVQQLFRYAGKSMDKDGTINLKDIKGKVVFKNVSFSYDPTRGMALKDISLSIEPSTKVAIVGPNGAGKTTLINLILRLYLLDSGIIEIDDVDISTVMSKSLRSQIGFVPQDIYLLSNTIGYNIAYGCPGKMEKDIIKSAKMAEAHDFIVKLPQGYKTIVGERGNKKFSGGEKQRISIARAFLKNPKILIFDEATSSIDNESAYYIQKAMKELMENRTTFIIAHQLATVVNSDYILVLDKGRIVQRGTHKTLLDQGGLYKNLYEKEFAS